MGLGLALRVGMVEGWEMEVRNQAIGGKILDEPKLIRHDADVHCFLTNGLWESSLLSPSLAASLGSQ